MSEQQQYPTTPKVLAAMEGVVSDIAKEGVAKSRTNTQQNFQYRGVDDVMDALAPLLAKHHLLILPSVMEHVLTERMSANQKPMLHAVLKLTYEFVCPLDGSVKMVGPIYGEAMDSGDKATNKAMSAAYKYLCTQSFCIPFSGDDPDGQSHEIAGAPADHGQRQEPQRESPSRAASAPRQSAQPASQPGEKPEVRRPGGAFGYGKKYPDTPWDMMKTRDLEFFLNGDYTPTEVRHKIVAEMAWRDYETAQMNRVDDEARAEREKPLEENVP